MVYISLTHVIMEEKKHLRFSSRERQKIYELSKV